MVNGTARKTEYDYRYGKSNRQIKTENGRARKNGLRLKESERIGTWNICGLMHKEPEIVEYMTQNKITILGIADTRKKETGTKQIHDNFVFIWSGVKREDRAKHGVGFVIHHEKAKDLVHTEFISERLLNIGIREGNNQWLTAIFQKAWKERKVPEDWQNAIVVPIWKQKGSKKDCSIYRGISLLSHVGKMYAKILEQRTRVKTEHLLSDA